MKKEKSCSYCGKPLNAYWQKLYCGHECTGLARRKGEVEYTFSDDGMVGYGKLMTGETFLFDSVDFAKICDTMWYRSVQGRRGEVYVADCKRNKLHRVILNAPKGATVDHINMDTLDNRKSNLRICTHRQNLCNRMPQSNNTSGVSGVSFKKNRRTWNARIKFYGAEIHLGAYRTFIEAVQARNEGMYWLYGEYGRYNDVPPAPKRIREYVAKKCSHFLTEMTVLNSEVEND